eukprot:CAMPEP_0185599864 /NCGR_PEP_ID=MMETSP0434-20130131/82996_1 /TAXON_ID=626734 ORGANISM="Favella taraikaensis, Strain Fe Narragansett Bay" /NCGR_SAMPLE_ID=MMETSP0434 /ASSEMBLY_ACC=CAM_ASM_000379 /LENGTH=40 /DNA_ID= /DNA_START= /DNA_END= /DNA_ORIENTATION=
MFSNTKVPSAPESNPGDVKTFLPFLGPTAQAQAQAQAQAE